MNRRFLGVLVVILVSLTSAATAVGVVPGESSPPIRVFVDGKQVVFPDQGPLIADGRTLVPLRGVFEAMGARVEWDPRALRATVRLYGYQVAVFIGSRTAWVNGSQTTLDVAPRLIGGRTMVPLRFIAEAFGLRVGWVDRERAVVVGVRPAVPVLAPYGDPDMEMPCTLRVALRRMGTSEPLTKGPYAVREVELALYVADVLAHEFGDVTTPAGVRHVFTQEALKAGAAAILMYGWYYAWNPRELDYDLDNSTNAQVYIPGKAGEKHLEAVRAIWDKMFVKLDKNKREIFPPQYGSGEYRFYGAGINWMPQLGALYLADRGYTWEQILHHYYPTITILEHHRSCLGPT